MNFSCALPLLLVSSCAAFMPTQMANKIAMPKPTFARPQSILFMSDDDDVSCTVTIRVDDFQHNHLTYTLFLFSGWRLGCLKECHGCWIWIQ